MTLKDLTHEFHKQAERSTFARALLKGLSPEEYYKYLYNQYLIYSALETVFYESFPKLRDMCRAPLIYEDLKELELKYNVPHATSDMIVPVVIAYERHVNKLDHNGILAHVYVRHFGDMHGGQIIKKNAPGSGKMYDFKNVEALKDRLRPMLADSMADEANRCFEFATQLFKELSSE